MPRTVHLRAGRPWRGCGRRPADAAGAGDTGPVILRLMRQPRAGGPSMLARVVALLIVLGLLSLTAPVLAAPLASGLQWLGTLL